MALQVTAKKTAYATQRYEKVNTTGPKFTSGKQEEVPGQVNSLSFCLPMNFFKAW